MKRLFFIAMILGILGGFFVLPENTTCVKANESSKSNDRKFFTNYIVEKDDTLWDIAEKYWTSEYESIHIYIEEIMKSNHLEDTKIIDGQMLILPYYADIPISSL